MSTVFEVIAAAHASLPVLGLSLITNEGVGPDEDKPKPTHEEVLAETRKATAGMQALVAEVVKRMDTASMPAPPAAALFSSSTALSSVAGKAASVARITSRPTEGTAAGGAGGHSVALTSSHLAILVGVAAAAGAIAGAAVAALLTRRR